MRVEALERLLDRLAPGDRLAVLDACYQNPNTIRVGVSQEMADLLAGPSHGPPSQIVRGERIRFDNLDLQRLWEAVEPSVHGAA